jgi:AcrR family transcriptional regulator
MERFVPQRTRTTKKASRDVPARKYDPEKTRRNILSVATEEFARQGFNGARIDAIAARTSTTKRMIYYYFGSKEKLYIAVLEQEYANIRSEEARLQLELLDPVPAVRRLTEFTFDYDHAHPNFVRLVAIENIHHAKHLAKSTKIRDVNTSIVDTLERILARGRKTKTFRADVRAMDVHMLMSALCFFQVSNLHTFGTIFHRNFLSPDVRKAHRKLVADFIVHVLTRA